MCMCIIYITVFHIIFVVECYIVIVFVSQMYFYNNKYMTKSATYEKLRKNSNKKVKK